ncbi:NEW3 domain-containing protein [Paenibacillus flagellatus]|uniref:Alpha-galactosidase NEW3 domain-containing protein n=1 Tax=Paenibacillus flagellatus TaxID=2211139 RepID=A0A2V5KJZ1_9BACL|nr:NEW3 domain-containing protein [Paenibacillus flagellatus]PYI55020.1 hypothetical protein DLM86_10795 [Paenibacillus flagellatus]
MKRTWAFVTALLCLLIGLTAAPTASAAGGLSLYTPYVSMSVQPGETINYGIDVINDSDAIQTADLSVQSAPDGWEYELTAGGRKIQRLSVKSKESQKVDLRIVVPLKVEKGAYSFRVDAAGAASLPLVVNVTEQGTYRTELETKQPNMEGNTDSTFTYSTTLKNRTASKQLYALKAEAPEGWNVQFTVDSKNVTSVNVEPNAQQDISVTVRPPTQIKADTYKIAVTASGSETSAKTELEAVVKGTFDMELSTSDGNLQADVTAGGSRNVTLKVTNKGSSALNDVTLSASAPVNWKVDFNPPKIPVLEPGQSADVQATIKADKKAIAGDYVVRLTSSSPSKSADAQLRMTVETSVLWGWIGVLIIAAVVAGVYSLFRRYGRR